MSLGFMAQSQGFIHRVDCVLHCVPHIKIEILQLELPRLDACEVENIVYETQKRVC